MGSEPIQYMMEDFTVCKALRMNRMNIDDLHLIHKPFCVYNENSWILNVGLQFSVLLQYFFSLY